MNCSDIIPAMIWIQVCNCNLVKVSFAWQKKALSWSLIQHKACAHWLHHDLRSSHSVVIRHSFKPLITLNSSSFYISVLHESCLKSSKSCSGTRLVYASEHKPEHDHGWHSMYHGWQTNRKQRTAAIFMFLVNLSNSLLAARRRCSYMSSKLAWFPL